MSISKQDQFLDYRMMELTTLNEIAKVVNSTLDLQEALDEIVRLTTARMRADACAVFLLENQVLVLRAARGLNMALVNDFSLALGDGLTGYAAKVGKPLTEKDIRLADALELSAVLGETDYVSLLSVPLIAKGRIVGVINVYMKTPRDFGAQEIHFLSSIAGLVAAAIRNSQLYLRATRMIDELNALKDVNNLLNETLDLNRILKVTAESAAYVTGSGGAVVRLTRRSKRTQSLDHVVTHVLENCPSPADLEQRETKHSEMTIQQGYPYMEAWFSDDGVRIPCHALCVPIEIQGRVQGTVCVYRFGVRESAYTSEERRLLGTLLSYAATCIENARLFEKVKRTEKELRDAHQQLFLREKLAALGEMAAGVAHELRNPLVSIGGYARRISKQVNNPEKVKESVSIITREVERLENLANDILKYVSPREPSFAPVDLASLFRDVFQMEFDFTGRQAKVILAQEVDPRAPEVWADREHLETALIDLVRNAVQACTNGGVVSVRSEPHADDPARVIIIVEDTGVGIPEETLQNIFTPFFTTKTTGSGLGLATTKNVIDAHEGEIAVESRVGEGTVFRVSLLRPPDQGEQQSGDGGCLE